MYYKITLTQLKVWIILSEDSEEADNIGGVLINITSKSDLIEE